MARYCKTNRSIIKVIEGGNGKRCRQSTLKNIAAALNIKNHDSLIEMMEVEDDKSV